MRGRVPQTVSCVIPVFNAESWIGESLDSVLGQSRPPDEVIVVDDGSTDGTAEVLKKYGARIKSVRQENAGPGAARNRGVALSTGALIAFQDADDVWLPEKLERQLLSFEERPALELSLTHLRCFWIEELREREAALQGHPLTRPSLPGWVFQTLVARRETLSRVGPLIEDQLIGEDTDWFLRARELGVAIEMLPDVLVLRRFHHNNLTGVRDFGDMLVDVVRRSVARRKQGSTGVGPPEGSAP